jgi:hypothetical protein
MQVPVGYALAETIGQIECDDNLISRRPLSADLAVPWAFAAETDMRGSRVIQELNRFARRL